MLFEIGQLCCRKLGRSVAPKLNIIEKCPTTDRGELVTVWTLICVFCICAIACGQKVLKNAHTQHTAIGGRMDLETDVEVHLLNG